MRSVNTLYNNIESIEKALASLRRSRRFIHYGESFHLARELRSLVTSIAGVVGDNNKGLEMMFGFFKLDTAIFNRCDDSSGTVGDVFRYEALELYVKYASVYHDKTKLAVKVVKFCEKDDFGIRAYIIDRANDFLPEPIIRQMMETFKIKADKETDQYQMRHYLYRIESLASQIKDARLFEETRIAAWGKLNANAYLDIARVYFASGDAKVALAWLEKISVLDVDLYEPSGAEQLKLEIYRSLNDSESLEELLRMRFNTHPSEERLNELLDVIGNDKRDVLIAQRVSAITKKSQLNYADITFLLHEKAFAEAEFIVLKHKNQINGDYYDELLPIADELENANCNLAASIFYRRLMLSILDRKTYKAYGHAAIYLRKLDHLAPHISDWKTLIGHDAFKQVLTETHGMKTSFWAKYEGRK
jgi:hypothetical protein